MADELDQVRSLKASAKSAQEDEDWVGAISDLDEAIEELEVLHNHAASGPARRPSGLAAQFSDTYGMIGGIQKRWAQRLEGEERQRHLAESLAAYDKGFEYERNLDPNDANTYNRVNRLVGRVLLEPSVLSKDSEGASTFADELREAEEILMAETSDGAKREKDPWAYCDLGTIKLLAGTPDALSTFRRLKDRLSPPAYVYDSLLNTLAALSEVASESRPEMAQAIAQLRRFARNV